MDYMLEELVQWDERIKEIADAEGLSCFPQEFEICGYEDMLCYEAYTGMPSHYAHWSYGKAYERKKTFYTYNLQGLPYEMVINANPCLAYLMRDNTLLTQILTMAHVYGHNDFFKNNRLFSAGARPENTVSMFKNHADRVRSYIQDPSIGYEKVERVLDAAHALRYQTTRTVGGYKPTPAEKKKRIMEKYYDGLKHDAEKTDRPFPDLNRVPLEPTEHIIEFLIEHSKLQDWEKDILQIVADETAYFIPQIETRILNEGWASFWHYRILNKLTLPDSLHLEFLNRHNQVIRPVLGGVNPYYLGFVILCDLEKKLGAGKIFEVRSLERDQSFLRRYLTREICEEMNLYRHTKKDKYSIIDEVADEPGWEEIRSTLANLAGMGSIPSIKVMEASPKDRSLLLEHEYDGRELELDYAKETLKYLAALWAGRVSLKTVLDGKNKRIVCNEHNQFSVEND